MTAKITYNFAQYLVSERYQHKTYYTNRLIRVADTFCRLKAWSKDSSCVKEWRSRVKELAQLCECSVRTLYTRLAQLAQMGWIDKDYEHLRIISWHELHTRLGIRYDKQFYTLPNKLKDETRTHYWIYLAEIEHNQSKQTAAIFKKLGKNHETKAHLYSQLKQAGRDMQACNSNPQYLLSCLQQLYIDEFASGSQTPADLIKIRPFIDRSCTGHGIAWHGGLSKEIDGDIAPKERKRLEKNERKRLAMVASNVKIQIVKQRVGYIHKHPTIESKGRCRNKHCHATWNEDKQVTFHAFCDTVTGRKIFFN